MTDPQPVTAAELHVLDAVLPPGTTEPMREVARALFESLIAGQQQVPTLAGVPGPESSPGTCPGAARTARLHALAHLAAQQTAHLCANLGGSSIYFAKGCAAQHDARAAAIWAAFTGRNHHQLARQYGLTVTRIRQIVQAQRQRLFHQRQGSIPGL